MASAPRAAWQRFRTSISRQVVDALEPQLAEISTRLDGLEARLGELRELAEAQVDIENQTAELHGRLLRAANSRIDELEERAGPRP